MEPAQPPATARPPAVFWVVTDGRAGNENPALGLAERAARRFDAAERPVIETIRLKLRSWSTALPAPAWPLFGASAGGWPFAALADDRDLGRRALVGAHPPALVIGAGRRAAPIVAALKRLSRGAIKTVQLLDPKLAPKRFDLVIAPRHDGPSAPGRLATVGSLHRIDPSAPPPPDPRLPDAHPRVALLIGGASKSASFGDLETRAVLEAVGALKSEGAHIAATASRRTPADAAAQIADAVKAAGGFYWDGDGDNPYRAMLFWADALIVTADSVNMASEAASLGKPVFIAPAERLAPKFRLFHEALVAGGHARALTDGVALESWRPTPLDDMTAATDAVLRLLRP